MRRASCIRCLERQAALSSRLLHLLLVVLVLVILSTNVALVVSALHVDEVGITDYVLRTAGHGDVGVRYAKVLQQQHSATTNAGDAEDVSGEHHDGAVVSKRSVWITSQSEMCPRSIVVNNRGGRAAMTTTTAITAKYQSDCSIAARDIATGALIWRVNACAAGNKGRHVTLATQTSIYSLDTSGILRIWDPTNGSLQLDINILDDNHEEEEEEEDNIAIITNPPRIFDLTTSSPPLLTSIIGTTIMSKSYTGVGEKTKKNKKKKGEEKYDDELLLLLDTTTGLPITNIITEKKEEVNYLSARKLLNNANVKPPLKREESVARIMNVHILDNNNSYNSNSNNNNNVRVGVWVCWSTINDDAIGSDVITSLSQMAFVVLEIINTVESSSSSSSTMTYRVLYTMPLRPTPETATTATVAVMTESFILSSTKFVIHGVQGKEAVSILAITLGLGGGVSAKNRQQQRLLLATMDFSSSTAPASSAQVILGTTMSIDTLHPYWRTISDITIDDTEYKTNKAEDGGIMVRISGLDDRYPTSILPRRIESMFLLKVNNGGVGEDDVTNTPLQRIFGPSKEDESMHHDALVYCPKMDLVVASQLEDENSGIRRRTIAVAMKLKTQDSSQHRRAVIWTPVQLTTSVDGDDVVIADAPPSPPLLETATSTTSPASAVGIVRRAYLIDCTNIGMTVVYTTVGGMTSAFRVDKVSNNSNDNSSSNDDDSYYSVTKLWTSEEALASISSAIFLDETHVVATPTVLDDTEDEDMVALRNLQFGNRMRSQLLSFESFIRGGVMTSLASLTMQTPARKAMRDATFGFAKIAVTLSEKHHRIVALDTAKEGRTVWSMNLYPYAMWHKLVHGGQFVALNDPRGNGGVHDHEMLVLSYVEMDDSKLLEWKCLDGVNGRLLSDATMHISASVMQTVPLCALAHHPHESRGCRQIALLVHSDNTVSVVPDTTLSYVAIDEAMSTSASLNGLFVHTLDEESGEFNSLRLTRKVGSELQPGSNPFELITVGSTIFDPSQETIINVAYPSRGEVIQSPSIVMGDDSLLLKYLNPHIVVIVTEATKNFLTRVAPISDGNDKTKDEFYNALIGGSSSTLGGQKRKPLGASKPGEEKAPSTNTMIAAATPSLFVTLVDTVSGQILHRVSHTHAALSDLSTGLTPSTTVPVVISENWIVYTFFNLRTRRTDIGILTLHEGMIDKNGITAFTSPEQELTFSSLESAKPIVLSKTFGLGKAVTAVGVTTTRAGISSKQYLFATSNDQIVSIDRRMLDPRRPSGEPKDSEKEEGLFRYEPILPIMPMKTPSHVYEVSSVQTILSASANVESQSLIIAFGGPDIFFTRLSPSKGFDLLPDDFNRGLLTVVVVGLIVLLCVMQQMNKKKMITTLWL